MKNLFLIISIIIVAISCEKTVTVNIPVSAPKLVVNGVTEANNIFKVTVSKSEAVLSSNNLSNSYINTALAQLYVNGLLKDTLTFRSTTNMYEAKNATKAISGNTYKVVVAQPGFTTVVAETKTPSNITIQSITRIANARTNANGQTQDEIKIKFLDNTTENNFYLFKFKKPIYNNGAAMVYDPIYCINSNDADIDRASSSDPTDLNSCLRNEFSMSDNNFNGNLKTITVFINSNDLIAYTNPFDQKKYKAILEMNSLSKNYYNYRRSLETYRDNEDNPFSEPVLVYTNVNNGYGIFSTYTFARDTIR